MSYTALLGGNPLLYMGHAGEASPIPRILGAANVNMRLGDPFGLQITATNPPHTSFNATGLPPGLTVNTTTGVIGGIPSALGPHVVTLEATNADGTGTRNVTFTVTPRPAIAWRAYFGPAPSLISVGGINIDFAFLQTLPNSLPSPAVGSVMVSPAPVGSFGPVFAYPNTLPPASGIQDSVAGPVLGSFTQLTVTAHGPNPFDVPQDYRVYFIRFAGAATVPGTTSTMTI